MTHSAPELTDDAVEMPAIMKRDLGLDGERSCVIATERTQFGWPGPDVRLVVDGQRYWGAVPDWLFRQVQEQVVNEKAARRLA